MSILFTPIKIGKMELPNRFVRSATGDRMAEGAGYVSDRKIELYSKLAAGGIGLVITGVTHVHFTGQMSFSQISIAGDDYIPGLKRLTKTVHDRGGKIAIQLFHAGREAARFRNANNEDALAPSHLENDPYFRGKHRPFTESEIWEVIRAYGDAAGRAREVGFDAVQVHAAHAYLPSQFLSPFTNRRADQWGGSLENRLRLHREIYLDMRNKVGHDFPILIKLGVEDGFAGGLEFREGFRAALLLAEWGYDSLEISQGLRGRMYEETEYRTGISGLEQEAYFRGWCREIKNQVNVPVMMVGGLRSLELMEAIVQKGEADCVSLCRPLIREPGIVKEWKDGSRRRAACISCNKCLEAMVKNKGMECIFNRKS